MIVYFSRHQQTEIRQYFNRFLNQASVNPRDDIDVNNYYFKPAQGHFEISKKIIDTNRRISYSTDIPAEEESILVDLISAYFDKSRFEIWGFRFVNLHKAIMQELSAVLMMKQLTALGLSDHYKVMLKDNKLIVSEQKNITNQDVTDTQRSILKVEIEKMGIYTHRITRFVCLKTKIGKMTDEESYTLDLADCKKDYFYELYQQYKKSLSTNALTGEVSSIPEMMPEISMYEPEVKQTAEIKGILKKSKTFFSFTSTQKTPSPPELAYASAESTCGN